MSESSAEDPTNTKAKATGGPIVGASSALHYSHRPRTPKSAVRGAIEESTPRHDHRVILRAEGVIFGVSLGFWRFVVYGVTVSVVIPALNEAPNLARVLPRIHPDVDEVILVDGRSTDATTEVARKLIPDIKIVDEKKRGKGIALRAGFEAARGDAIVMLDADGSTDPAEIPLFVGALLAGADFVKGSRFIQGGGSSDLTMFRRMGNRVFVQCIRTLFGGEFSDVCYGYNAFWRWVLPHLDLDCDGFEIETMMNVRALRAGLKVAEVPSFEYRRLSGESNLRAIPDGYRIVRTIAREFVRRRGGDAARGWTAIDMTRRATILDLPLHNEPRGQRVA